MPVIAIDSQILFSHIYRKNKNKKNEYLHFIKTM